MKMIPTRKQECPFCGKLLNAASSLQENLPIPGDITICAACLAVLKFGDAMDLCLATPEEIKEVEQDLAQYANYINKQKYSLTDAPKGSAILCHLCGNTSHNKNDIENLYCGYCHQFLH